MTKKNNINKIQLNETVRIATVFSGIGAVEESFKQLKIPTNIVFACDNGEREPKLKLKVLFDVANHILTDKEQKKFIDKLIENMFIIKHQNKSIVAIAKKEFKRLSSLNDEIKIKDAIANDGKTITNGKEEYTYQIQHTNLQDSLSFLNEDKTQEFVKKWYETTGVVNYMKLSYLANYKIENNNWYEDIRFINGKKYRGKVDVIVGGSPCQSFSTYGKKKGLDDTRGTLFYDYARLISEIKPKVFIYENVKGLLTHDKKKTWQVIKEVFESLDYTIKYEVLNAKDYGLPQLRRRIFVVGIRNDIPNRSSFSFPKPIKLIKKSTDYLEDNIENKYYLGKKGFEWMVTPEKNKRRSRVNQDIIGCQTANQQDNWIGDFRIEKPKASHYIDPRIYIGKYEGKDAVARKMKPIECLRLMGFKNFKLVLEDKRIYRQAGNSIAIPVLNALFKELKTILKY